MRCRFFLVSFLIFLFSGVPLAMAHRVNVFAVDEGGTVYTESSFSGKRAVKGGAVKVLDESGALLLSGVTDENGVFTFARPDSGVLDVVVEAGPGHQGLWRLDALSPKDEEAKPPISNASEAPLATTGLTRSELQSLVTASVEKAMLRMEKKQRLQDIIGGLGYIIGLFGVVAFVKAGQRQGARL